VPLSATSSSPFLLLSAPVNAPRMWRTAPTPGVLGHRAAVQRHHGLSRERMEGMAADQPLPVPDSPVSRIVLLVRATVSII